MNKLVLITHQGSRLCHLQATIRKGAALLVIGCDALSNNIEELYEALYIYIRTQPMIGGSVKTFEHELTVSNYRQIRQFKIRGSENTERSPSFLKFSGINTTEAISLKNQLEHFITFMTGFPPKY